MENALFLPLFYASLNATRALSDAEFGLLVRTLLKSRAAAEPPSELPENLIMPYMFMSERAASIFNAGASKKGVYKPRSNYTREAQSKNSYGEESQSDYESEEPPQKNDSYAKFQNNIYNTFGGNRMYVDNPDLAERAYSLALKRSYNEKTPQ